MPQDSTILSCALQKDMPYIWALVDTDSAVVGKNIVVDMYETGIPVHQFTGRFLGTLSDSVGYVVHIFVHDNI